MMVAPHNSCATTDPLPFDIGAKEIHVWLIESDDTWDAGTAATYRNILSEEEHRKLAGFFFERDRWQYLVAHAALRLLLSAYRPSVRPESWRFKAGTQGRPDIADEASGLTFNLSHTLGGIALAFARGCRLGVDIERPGEEADLDLAETICAADEIRALGSLPQSSQAARFTRLWTLKEAYLKALGTGLSLPANCISFQLSGDDVAGHQILAPDAETDTAWSFYVGTTGQRCKFALAWSDDLRDQTRNVQLIEVPPNRILDAAHHRFAGLAQATLQTAPVSIVTV